MADPNHRSKRCRWKKRSFFCAFFRLSVDDPIDRELVRSINEIGHVMGKKTIAEFVESQEILAALGEIGVDYAQGFELGKPSLLPKR